MIKARKMNVLKLPLNERTMWPVSLVFKTISNVHLCNLLQYSQGLDVPFWKKILGGKLDDITVIVGQVVTTPSSGILDDVPKTEEVQGTESVGILDEVQRIEKIGGNRRHWYIEQGSGNRRGLDKQPAILVMIFVFPSQLL